MTVTIDGGLFVVFEGGDGAGKSTQVRELAGWLAERDVPHVVTREPGGTEAGQKMRTILLDPATGHLAPRAEALLYIADKAQHVDEVVRPALGAGQVVVCDRYTDSLLAYQGAGRALAVDEVDTISRWGTHNLRPHLTVLLDVDPAVAVHTKDEQDRLEAAGVEFHQRVREGFLGLAAADPDHYLVLPAREPREWIARQVRARVADLLGLELRGCGGTMAPP
ncbi:dTMP kinase [Aestuariimicrobium sp. T2.26MG-19.2B]|uniref:dTMP kinase n=1 Tax=Aestuariimicrobium sp. T2.26MG-19.2B TaxID=3040679 RepID=UPI002477B6D3|nr:dTMP kinase [Aestuariimicrobium sp. T2.26MG-19.2B]CAI9404851.1 Thymidylate kinase [Aestuariimicrobium sp. T2.26MG-19.2B]